MTFLAYSYLGDNIYACMDTLGKSENEDFFVEKAFYLKNNHILLCVKGVVRLSFPLIDEVLKMDATCSLQEIEKFLLENMNKGLRELKAHSWIGHDSKNTIRLLYWDDNKPMASMIDNVMQEYFVLSRNELLPGKIISNNNSDFELLRNSDHWDEVSSLYSDLRIKYKENATISVLGASAYASRLNDPPSSYTGGKIFLYSLSMKAFSQELLYTFDDYQENLFISFEEMLEKVKRELC